MLRTEDIQQAVIAAELVGDDRLQQNTQGYVMPDSLTHGSSVGRMTWLKYGLESGDVDRRDTFTTN